MQVTLCPSVERLRGYVLGTLSEAEIESLAAHVLSCPQCESTLQALDGTRDSLLDALARPLEVDPYAHEPDVQQAIENFKSHTITAVSSSESSETDHGRAVAASASQPSAPPSAIREYRLIRELGRGGMGAVYLAEHTRLKRTVALKVLAPEQTGDSQSLARFSREMAAVGRLEHPHIVRATDAGEHDGVHYLVMEFVPGETLAQVVRRCGPLPLGAACELLRQAAVALQYVHEHGLVHRDIKPGNLMLAWDPTAEMQPGAPLQRPLLKILDLGLARLHDNNELGSGDADSELTGAGQAMGTLDYMAPEQWGESRAVDIRADLYALGATFYKLLTGESPFPERRYKNRVTKLAAALGSPPEPVVNRRPECPAPLAALLDRLLAKDPADRPATPAEVAAAVAPFCQPDELFGLLPNRRADACSANDLAVAPPPAAALPVEPLAAAADRVPPVRRKRLLAAAAALPLLLFGLWLIVRDKDGREVARFPLRDGDSFAVQPEEPPLAEGEDRAPADPTNDASTLPDTSESSLPAAAAPSLPPVLRPAGKPLNVRATVLAPAVLPGAGSWTLEIAHNFLEAEQCEVSPDGQWVAVATRSGTIRLLDAATRRLVKMLATDGHVTHSYFSWSPDSRYLATPGSDENGQSLVHLWDVAEGRRCETLRGDVPSTEYVSWHPDGDLLATSSSWFPCENSIGIWSRAQRKLIAVLRTEGGVLQARWSPDGKWLAALGGFLSGLPTLWDAQTFECVGPLGGPEWKDFKSGTHYLSWSPSGRELAVTFKERNEIRIWSLEQQAEICQIAVPPWELPVTHAWSADGTLLAIRVGQLVLLVDPRSGQLQSEFPMVNSTISWTPSGQFVAVRDGAVTWWSPDDPAPMYKSRRLTPSHNAMLDCVPWDAVGYRFELFQLSSAPLGYATLPQHRSSDGRWSLATEIEEFDVLPDRGAVQTVAFSSDGRYLAMSREGEQTLRVWDLSPRRLVAELRHPTDFPYIFCWSADSRAIAAVGIPEQQQTQIALWNLESPEPYLLIPLPFDVRGLAFRPDGGCLALGGLQGIQLWDLASKRELDVIQAGTESIGSLVWRPDGRTLVFASAWEHGRYGTYDTLSGLLTRRNAPLRTVRYVLSRDGRMYVYNDGYMLRGWDVDADRPIVSLAVVPENAWLAVSAAGHFTAPHALGHEDLSSALDLRYVVELEDGQQQTLTGEEFQTRFGWVNDPAQVPLGPLENPEPPPAAESAAD